MKNRDVVVPLSRLRIQPTMELFSYMLIDVCNISETEEAFLQSFELTVFKLSFKIEIEENRFSVIFF